MPNPSQLIVVESEPYLQVILEAALGDSATVNYASTGAQCLSGLGQSAAIFIDLLLEDVDGLSLVERIRLQNREVPIIAFVAQTEIGSLNIEEAATRSMAEKSGADAVFFAPFNLGEILHTTSRILQPVAATA
ncbi:MAG: response regulator [Pseudomonadales bacterium]|nr:response regulator [Gammaproteobacteria bacterium]NNL57808.1 response regulator [Pseudomonadales bacterium]